jgi:hypothetical protein
MGALGYPRWGVDTNLEQIRLKLVDDWPLLVLAFASILPLASAAPFAALVAGGWTAATILLLLFYSPLAEKHVAYLMPPAALLAGCGLAAAVSLVGRTATTWRRLGIALLASAVAWYALALDPTLRARWQLTTPPTGTMAPGQDLPTALALVTQLTAPHEYFVTDHPYAAYLAGRLVPPQLVDISRTRIRSLAISSPEVSRQTNEYHATVIMFWAGRLQLLREYDNSIENSYTLARMYDRNRAIYVRKDLAARLPERENLPVAPQATFGGQLDLADVQLERTSNSRSSRLSLTWQAERSFVQTDYVVVVELRAVNGKVVWSRDDRMVPLWHSGRWEPAQPIVQRRGLSFDNVPNGNYQLTLSVQLRRGGELVSVTVPPGTSLRPGAQALTLDLGTISLR